MVLEHVARYRQPSEVRSTPGGETRIFVATSLELPDPPLFFQGRLTRPRPTADLLLALSRVVAARYHVPRAMLARILRESDPVVTCGLDRIRWEGFSACCSLYARLDLLPESLEGALLAQGTTNVDFGAEMRAALARLRQDQVCRLAIGPHEVELDQVVERRVSLPLRWLKGFVEAQALQAGMELRYQLDAAEARRFLCSLPRTRGSAVVTSAGRGLRLSQAEQGLRVAGLERLRILEDVVRHACGLRIYAHPGGASAWELVCEGARFHLVLSPETWRGFSGEGKMLEPLSREVASEDVESVRQALSWEPVLSPEGLAARTGLSSATVTRALAQLAGVGAVGYDLELGGYFRRRLPFDYSRVEALQPRLKSARRLLASDGVRWEGARAWVRGGGVEHQVRVQGEKWRCTCPWFARHSGERGPCKHVLAAQLSQEEQP
ncbi:MAG: SWIM zinc finger family protein [Armatimonadetes bacterium]|nr:SWIM zinc finger family protein [Armatimonadota bacterium]